MMAPLQAIERSQLVPWSAPQAFAFFTDAYNLEAITPPWLRFRILTPRPIPMHEGTLIDYRLSLHHLRFRWHTRIDVWHPGVRFVDRQLSGPFGLWEHTHTFEATPDGTLIHDHIVYRMPFGPLGRIAHRAIIRRDLERIFDYRHDAIDRLLATTDARCAEANAPDPHARH